MVVLYVSNWKYGGSVLEGRRMWGSLIYRQSPLSGDPSTILQGVLKSNLLMIGCFWESLVSIKGLKKILMYRNLEIWCMKTTVF